MVPRMAPSAQAGGRLATVRRPAPCPRRHFAFDWRVGAALAFIAIGPAVLAFRCWAAGVQRAGPNAAGFFVNLTPLFAAMLSALFLGEMPHGYHALAFALIVAGIVLSSRRPA